MCCFACISREAALEAFAKFNGRWYGGRQLSCRFSCVSRWKMAICGEHLVAASYFIGTSWQDKLSVCMIATKTCDLCVLVIVTAVISQ